MDTILVADCGSALTKLALIEGEADDYRLVARSSARSTHRLPWNDIGLGLVLAIRRLEQLTDRRLLLPAEQLALTDNPLGRLVDTFLIVSSAGEPLRLVLGGLMSDFSLDSAWRAAATTYTSVSKTLSLSQAPTPRAAERQLAALFSANPEVVLLAGGTDEGARRSVVDLIETVAMALTTFKDHLQPRLIFAGNSSLRPVAAKRLGVDFDLKSIANVRPTLARENLADAQIELESLYVERKLNQVPGFDAVRRWSPQQVVPTAKSFAQTMRYLGTAYDLNIIGADVGSTATTVAVSRPGFQNTTIRADVGLGLSLPTLIESAGLDAIARWLPFEMGDDELQNILQNKTLYPDTIPETFEETLIELAVAREALRIVVAQSRRNWPSPSGKQIERLPWDMIFGSGGVMSSLPHPVYAALALLDGLEPTGVSTLSVDANGVLGMLGGLAAANPAAAASLAEADHLLRLGTVVALAGQGRPGATAVRVKVSYPDGRTATSKVRFGSIELISLEPGEKASLELRPAPRFDIGLGQWGKGARAEVEGGLLGLIIDARGRPLNLATNPESRREQLRTWLTNLGPASWEVMRMMGRIPVEII
jgi:hypothetical protein